MDTVISLLKLAYLNVIYLAQRIIHPICIEGAFFIRPSGGFHFRIRRNGKIHLESLKTRGGFRCIADGGEIFIGAEVFFNYGCSLNSLKKITIGRGTIFGENVKVYDHDHVISGSFEVHPTAFVVREVTIGENCWIGSNVVILKGVSITNNVVIGANSIVTKSISAPGIYASKPQSTIQRIR